MQLHGSISFVTNTANYAGGGLHSEYSHVSVEGDGRYINNSAMFVGGVAIGQGGGLTLDGSITFAWNKAHQGGGIDVQNSSLSSRNNISFTNNLADDVGGGLLSINSTLKLHCKTCRVEYVASVCTSHTVCVSITLTMVLCVCVSHNVCVTCTYLQHIQHDSFYSDSSYINNTATHAGGGLYSEYNNVSSMEGDGRFINNTAQRYGGGIFIEQGGGGLTLDGSITFAENKAHEGGGINVQSSSLSSRGHITSVTNLANASAGALASYNSNVRVVGNGKFINNSALYGGGIVISHGGVQMLDGSSTFAGNKADVGGGIKV